MSDSQPIVIVGADGMLGRALLIRLRESGRSGLAPSLSELDLTRPAALEPFLAHARPAAVINAAAYTDVGGCELPENEAEVFAVNRDGPGKLARACRGLGVPLIHLSTDYVFDGKARSAYREDDPVAPLQVYGQSKLEGELAVFEALPEALVVRTSTLYGPGPRPRPHYVDAILAQARKRTRLAVVRLPVSSPTYAPDLATAILRLLDAGAHGRVHAVNEGGCSRLELARATVRFAGLTEQAEVEERPEPPGGLRRPDYSMLDTRRYREWTGVPIRGWEAALEEYVESCR